jgi:hypothetical protein
MNNWQITLIRINNLLEGGGGAAASLWSSDDLFAESLEGALSDDVSKNKKFLNIKI